MGVQRFGDEHDNQRFAVGIDESVDGDIIDVLLDDRRRAEPFDDVHVVRAGAPAEEQVVAGDRLEVRAPRARELRVTRRCHSSQRGAISASWMVPTQLRMS